MCGDWGRAKILLWAKRKRLWEIRENLKPLKVLMARLGTIGPHVADTCYGGRPGHCMAMLRSQGGLVECHMPRGVLGPRVMQDE